MHRRTDISHATSHQKTHYRFPNTIKTSFRPQPPLKKANKKNKNKEYKFIHL